MHAQKPWYAEVYLNPSFFGLSRTRGSMYVFLMSFEVEKVQVTNISLIIWFMVFQTLKGFEFVLVAFNCTPIASFSSNGGFI